DQAGRGSEHLLERDVEGPADRDDTLRVDGVAERGDRRLVGDLPGDVPGERPQLLMAAGEREDLAYQAGDRQRLADRLRALREEQAVLGPGSTTGELPRRPHPSAPR